MSDLKFDVFAGFFFFIFGGRLHENSKTLNQNLQLTFLSQAFQFLLTITALWSNRCNEQITVKELTVRTFLDSLEPWFPNIFHLRTPWQRISISCTFHISKIFVINIVAIISNLYVVTVNRNC